MSNIQAQRTLDGIPAEVENIMAKSVPYATKAALLQAVAVKQAAAKAQLATSATAGRLMVGGSSINSGDAYTVPGVARKGLATPPITLSAGAQESLYTAAKSGSNLRVELKDASSSDATRTQLPPQYIGLVDRRFEPTRILDHIPTSSMAGPSIEFITHTANTVALGTPVISLGTAASGGSFAAGTFFWKLTATNSGGETIASNELTATLTAGQKQPINWSAITGANGYRLYRGVAAGAENALVAVIPGGATVTYTDLGVAGTSATPPTIDRTAGAQTVHAGGLFPETSLTTVATILSARKLAIFTTIIDELLADFPTFKQYLDVELTRQITDAENWQLLNGDGTGDNLLGLLNQPGTLSRAFNGTALDTIEQGITDLRNGPSYCEPDAIIINPSTWSGIRRTKNTLGNYILGDPGQTTVSDVWGIPVLQTTQIVPGEIVLANLELGAQAFIREGITLNLTNSADADFTHGQQKLRAEERLTLGVSRPTAINILTGF